MGMGRRWIGSTAGAAVLLALLAAPGDAAGTAASFNPDPVDFGNVQSGSALAYVTATNQASTSRTFRDTQLNLGAGFAPDDNATPTTGRDQACYSNGPSFTTYVEVAPGDSCRLYYRFTPPTTGSFSAQPQIEVRDPNGPASEVDAIVLRASSFTPSPATTGAFTVSPTSLGFGNVAVGQSRTMATTLTNTSNGNVQVHTAYPAGSPFSTAASSTCHQPTGPALVLAPHDTCTIAVTFAPVLNGAVSGAVSISLTPADGLRGSTEAYSSTTRLVTKSMRLRGTGVGPKFTLTPTSLSFGTVTVGGGKTLPVTVKNTSTVPLEFASSGGTAPQFAVVLGDQNASDCTGGELVDNGGPFPDFESRSQVIGPGQTCRMTIGFAPSAAGALSATLPIQAYAAQGPVGSFRDPSGQTAIGGLSLKVSGTGAVPTFTMSKTSLAFGNVTQTDGKAVAVTFKNTSTIRLQFGSDLATDSTFAVLPSDGITSCMSEEYVPPDWENPFGSTLRRYRAVAPGASCGLTFVFQPSELGPASHTLPVQIYQALGGAGFQDAGVDVATRQIGATGTGVAPTFTFSPSSLAFGQRTVASFKKIVVTVKNTSPVPLQFSSSLSTIGTPYLLVVPETDQGTNCMRRYTVTQFPDPDVVVDESRAVAPGATCTFTFGYDPQTVGASTAQLPVTFYRSSASAGFASPGLALGTTTLKATGTAVVPTFSFTPGTIAYGNVTVGGTKTVAVTVKNTSDAMLAFGTSFTTVGSPYAFVPPQDAPQGASCLYDTYYPPQFPGDPGFTDRSYRTVAPGATCVLTFAFTPTSKGAAPAGSFPVQVYDAYNSPGSYTSNVGQQRAAGTIKATGSGVAGTFTLTPGTLSYGTVPVGSHRTLTTVVKNTSTSPAQYAITVPRDTYRVALVSDDAPADCIANDDGDLSYVTVAPGASCDLRIDFRPAAAGADNQTIKVDAYAAVNTPGFYSSSPGTQVVGSKNLTVTGRGSQP